MPALLFGSIGSVADTSELQREAFNRAFAEHELDWDWDQETYQDLLTSSGGASRISDFAHERGEQVDADAVHATKTEIFQTLLGERSIGLRDGVADAVSQARADGFKVGLVTTTDPENISVLLQNLDGLKPSDFDLIVDTTQVASPKPDPAAYELALQHLGESPANVVAVEDNVGGVEAAKGASIKVVAFPGENNAGHDFDRADQVVDHLEFDALAALTKAA